jgi:hypothetical protein
MENINKTIWNKKKNFSDTASESIDENFQTINMIRKIKRAKKNKKSEVSLENYKNIESLQNIYDEPSEKIKEGFTDDDYDGIEKPFGGDKPDNPKTILINFIDSCFNGIDKFNHEKAQLIANIFSHRTATSQDVKLLQKYIGYFETIGLSYFVAYNWFFYLFYDVNYDPTHKVEQAQKTEKQKPVQPEFSQGKITDVSRKYPIIDLWIWFCEYVIIFTEYFQWMMITIFPFFFSVFNYKTCFVFLFFMFIYVILNFMPTLRNVLVDALNLNTGNTLIIWMFILFILLYAPSYWFPAKSDNENDQAAAANTQNLVMMSPYLLIVFVLYRFVRAFFVIILTIPLGAIALALYVLFYSFFGVLSYYFFNIFKAYEVFNNMYVYIKDGTFQYFTEEQKENFNIMQKFAIVVNNFFESLHRYVLFIVYIIMLLVAGVDYFNLMEAPLLKTNMLIITFVLCCICLSILVTSFINHAYNDEIA